MSRLLGIIGSGILAAVAFAFLFWWVNNFHQVKGVGWLRRQDWPINSPWFWAAAGFAVGSFGGFVNALHRADHARKARELAETLGREFAKSYVPPPKAVSMPVFEGFSNARNAMTGHEGGVSVTLFDYTTITQGGESNTVTDGTIVLLPTNGLPDFDLRPRTLGRRILGWAGFEGMTFDPSLADPADAEKVRRFTESFYLAPMDPLAMVSELTEHATKSSTQRPVAPFRLDPFSAMGELMENRPPEWSGREEAVRRLFTPAVMEAINQYPAYAMQSRNGFLAVWRGSGVQRAHARPELWDAAAELRTLLASPRKGEASPIVPGRFGTDAGRQLRKVRNSLVGGGVGAFVGFVLSAMAISLVFFRLPPGQVPGFTLFLHPLLFFGLILGGATIGAAIASRLPVRHIPPEMAEDPARRRSRHRAIVFGVITGFVTCFFGGFIAFALIEARLNWKLDHGMKAALFFGSMFGGALFGGVTCGLAVNAWYRWRQRRQAGARM
jgi:hypothetical protein